MLFAGLSVEAKPPVDGPLLDVKITVPLGARSQVLRDRLDPTDVLLIRIDREESGMFTIRLFNVDDKDVRLRVEPVEKKPDEAEGCHIALKVLYPDPEKPVRTREGVGSGFPSPPLYNLEDLAFPPTHSLGAGAPPGYSLEISNLPFYSAGAVPDGDRLPGSPLQVEKAPDGGLVLKWDPSCHESDADYEVYEGALGDFGSHAPVLCSTHGNTSAIVTSGSGSRYYLVVPRNGRREGSYGTWSDGTEIKAAASPCLVQKTEPCRRN